MPVINAYVHHWPAPSCARSASGTTLVDPAPRGTVGATAGAPAAGGGASWPRAATPRSGRDSQRGPSSGGIGCFSWGASGGLGEEGSTGLVEASSSASTSAATQAGALPEPQLFSEPAAVHAAKSLTAFGSLVGPFGGMKPVGVHVKSALLLMPPDM
jgi:hypothetical protein